MDRENTTADRSAESITQCRIDANLSIGSGSYQLVNDMLVEQNRARVRYKNGITVPDSAIQIRADLEAKLRMDAARDVRHSRTLSRNIKNATGQARDAQADAHHIVAQKDLRAERSRNIIFRWGIGINDSDNGMYLRKLETSKVTGLGAAPAHSKIHTDRYHVAVQDRLRRAVPDSEMTVRGVLKAVKALVLKNQFTY